VEAKQQEAKARKLLLETEAMGCNTQEALRHLVQQVLLTVVAEVLDFGAGRAAATPTAVQEEERAVPASLVAVIPMPLLLPLQAHLVLLLAKPLLSTCSTPRTSKALE